MKNPIKIVQVFNFFRLILFIFIIILAGCSKELRAEKHLRKAVKLDPSIEQVYQDTVEWHIHFVDTIWNADSTYRLEERYFHYDTVIKYTKVQADFSDLKNWWEKLQEEKTKRTQIRNERKENIVEVRQNGKTDRTDIRNERKENNKFVRMAWPLLLILIVLIVARFLVKSKFLKEDEEK